MSLLGNGTLANQDIAYYSGGGGGGGGGGPVISTVTVTASTLTVSSIVGGGPGQSLSFPNGLEMPTGAAIVLAGGGAPSAGDIEFPGNNGQLVGVSTINGAAYPPAGGAASLSTVTASLLQIGQGQSFNINPVALNVTNGKWYLASLQLTDVGFSGIPNATDAFSISIEDATSQTNLGTYNMAQLSTNRGILNEDGFSVAGPYEALSTNAYFKILTNTGAPSTTLVTGGIGWLTPLN